MSLALTPDQSTAFADEPIELARDFASWGRTSPQMTVYSPVFSLVAHELRSPLAALSRSAEVLLDDYESLEAEQLRYRLSLIRHRSVWLQSVVENLLNASSLEQGKFRIWPSCHEP